jgi:hypothetical protein
MTQTAKPSLSLTAARLFAPNNDAEHFAVPLAAGWLDGTGEIFGVPKNTGGNSGMVRAFVGTLDALGFEPEAMLNYYKNAAQVLMHYGFEA